jgi:simple sugar transport system ATP-binding protein
MYRGKILAVVSPDTPREEIGLLMAGVMTAAAGGSAGASGAAPAPETEES